MTALDTALSAARLLDNKKAKEIEVLRIEDLTTVTDYFVLATGTSNTQVRALAEEVEEGLSKRGLSPLHVEGADSRSWVLLDYGAVIVHVFLPEARRFYDLERLWADGKPVQWQEEETDKNAPTKAAEAPSVPQPAKPTVKKMELEKPPKSENSEESEEREERQP